ncbi:MAG: hypothetical protein ACR2NZ_12385, partial [Rubripirellula sp.]
MPQSHQTNDTSSIRGLFASVLCRVLLTWVLFTTLSTLIASWLAPELLWPSVTIAGMSGLISVFA